MLSICKNFIFLFFILFLGLNTIPVIAGEADSKKTRTVKSEKAPIPRIAIINLQKLMQESTAAQSLRKQVENVATKTRDLIAKKEDEMRDAQRELAKQKTVLAKDAFEKKKQAWEKKVKLLNDDVENRKEGIERASDAAVLKIQKEIASILDKITERKKVNVVLRTDQVMQYSPNLDVTAEVLTELNNNLKDIKLDMKAGLKNKKKEKTPAPKD